MDTKFSVLMSVYKNDKADYLLYALESISIKQEYKPNQIVLVIDGYVGDDIISTISNFEKSLDNGIELTVIHKKQNQGLAAALNTGLSACTYDLVARMDSDDISLPERFKLQVDYMEKHLDIDVLGGNILEFEFDENIIVDKREVPCEYIDIVKMLKTRNPINHVSVMYRKGVVLDIGGYSVNFGKLEDYKLWVDMVASNHKIHNLSNNLVKVRVGNGFIDRRSNKHEIEDWDMLQRYLISVGLINKKKALLNKIYIRIFIFTPKWLKRIIYKVFLRKKAK